MNYLIRKWYGTNGLSPGCHLYIYRTIIIIIFREPKPDPPNSRARQDYPLQWNFSPVSKRLAGIRQLPVNALICQESTANSPHLGPIIHVNTHTNTLKVSLYKRNSLHLLSHSRTHCIRSLSFTNTEDTDLDVHFTEVVQSMCSWCQCEPQNASLKLSVNVSAEDGKISRKYNWTYMILAHKNDDLESVKHFFSYYQLYTEVHVVSYGVCCYCKRFVILFYYFC